MKPNIKLGYYKHFKGERAFGKEASFPKRRVTVYRVFSLARDSENQDNWLVCYGNAHGDWVRAAESFAEQVDHDGKTVSRFEFLEEAIR